ncbi:MAG: CopD family protein [Leptospiraceae bacterium]|nr:CopD family protein [Leptospiraceae bacterium]
MTYLYLKAVHIIFIVTWFSGLFYLGRLYIYNTEANLKPEPEKSILESQFRIMIRRLLFGITWPSAILSLATGFILFFQNLPIQVWLQIKLALVVLLFFYHLSLHILYKQQFGNKFLFTSFQLRIWNEVPTIFLVSIVIIVVLKEAISIVYGILGLTIFIILLLLSIRLYKKIRENN